MNENNPLLASGPRELKRPRPIPQKVRRAIELMVYGKDDDEDCAPLDFIEAAKLAEVAPDHMRRYLDRAEVRALLRRERRVFREAICAGNEDALRRQRDGSKNGMVVVAAVRALEMLDTEEGQRPGSDRPTPGVVIRIVTNQDKPAPRDVTPAPAVQIIEHEGAPLDVETEAQAEE